MIHLVRLFWYFLIRYRFLKIKTCNYFRLKLQSFKSKEKEVAKKVVEQLREEVNLPTEAEEPNGNVAEPQNTATTTVEANPVTVPKDKAYSIVFDTKANRWQAVELYFDYETGVFGGLKVIESNPQKYIIIERFHTLVGRNLF